MNVGLLTAATGILILIGTMTYFILTARQLRGSSLFNRLFIVVAVTSACFSSISSAIGFGLITSQENEDLFRNAVLPPAFGMFVFFVTVAIWVGGAELVRNRDWFRALEGRSGLVPDGLFFLERLVKLFVVIPILAMILFLVSTWTSVVGIAGVDAVRLTYTDELNRLQRECTGIVSYRQNDLLFLDDLKLAITDVRRAARREQESGGQTGIRGRGPAADYIDGVADWLTTLEASAIAIVDEERGSAETPRALSPYSSTICARTGEGLKQQLSKNAFDNYDAWTRGFEAPFDDFTLTLNRWRRDNRLLSFMAQQLDSFDRANPKPISTENSRRGDLQAAVIERYATEVKGALGKLVSRQKRRKPPKPLLSAAERSPERGLEIFRALFWPKTEVAPAKRISRTQAVVDKEIIPGLSVITPRDAVLKNFQIFSDVWALAMSWDYASYILLLAFLFFPSAERAAGFKDGDDDPLA
ncbi:MAG: hypothetical protein AAFR20_11545 [Pseudomonadota bacterium]